MSYTIYNKLYIDNMHVIDAVLSLNQKAYATIYIFFKALTYFSIIPVHIRNFRMVKDEGVESSTRFHFEVC